MEGLKMLVDESTEDEEMRSAAIEELRSISKGESEDLHRMLTLMLPQDEADSRGCILEVRAGM
jgi:protein subunit release factor A